MKNHIIELPILFNAPMVQAILAGKKTQTRRVMAKKYFNKKWVDPTNHPNLLLPANKDKRLACKRRSPYGQKGDLLWVKETCHININHMGERAEVVYNADGATTLIKEWPWKKPKLSSIHMPLRLARLWLRVNNVWIQRLHDISLEDALSEGVNSKAEFYFLWDSINKKAGYGWNINPWVWVVEFDRFEKLKEI